MNPKAFALQMPVKSIKNNQPILTRATYSGFIGDTSYSKSKSKLTRWKMSTAVGGGPVLVQNNAIRISNNEERKFGGNAINDRHPRTAMGYTKDNILIILVVQGRFPGAAEGASLIHEASILKDLGCVEALNLDGGGSSCLLINGKETIAPSDKIQRAIPAVFIINSK
jgi:exopolysaccharide biosynthesis protein